MKLNALITLGIILMLAGPLVDAKQKDIQLPTQITFVDKIPANGHLILGVFYGAQLGSDGQAIDQNSNGALSHAIKATEFDAKFNTSQMITAPMNSGFKQILLVGLGDPKENKSNLQWQELGGELVQKSVDIFKTVPPINVDISDIENSTEIVAHIAYGAKLGSYYFDKYYTDKERQKYQDSLTFVTDQTDQTQQYFAQQLNPVADAIWFTRNISNEPANIIYPQSFIDQWTKHFKDMDNIKIRVLDEKDMLKKGMGAIYGVGQGSKNPPRIMIIEYMGGEKGEAPVVLVGKGITFDTGGISIKGSKNMWNMKFDMSGAASAIGTIYALAGRQAKVNVVGIAALAENMPDGNAQRPGDVITSMSGKTIQIRSTDAEGRLVLADGIYYADTTYNPVLLVDLATLTGSASRALGKDYAALFTRHDDLVSQFIAAGQQSGDQVWQLPLNDNHFKAIENNIADVMNSGPTAPGASAGAAFIGTFVRDTTSWVHFDIAGVAYNDEPTAIKASPGSTSFGIRLLNTYIKKHYENN